MADPQIQCGFFRLPFEIREAIYLLLGPLAIHLSRQRQRIVISHCKTPNPSHEDDGGERCPNDKPEWYFLTYFPKKDVEWGRRLRSTWGAHWACEELRKDEEAGILPLLFVCKKLAVDLIELLTVHITDVDTLDTMCKSQPISEALIQNDWMGSIFFCGIRILHVTLRLPLQLFQAIDGNQDVSEDHFASASLWTNVWPAVSRLGNLQKIEIQIDHLDPSSWSLVNERAILSPIAALGKNAPHITVAVWMPYLHPLYEDSDRHFTDEGAKPSFTIARRVRQKYHYGEDSNGQCHINKSCHDTFPAWSRMMDILSELEEAQAEIDGVPYTPETSERRQERIDQERADWRQGIEVMKKVDELAMDVFVHPHAWHIYDFPEMMGP